MKKVKRIDIKEFRALGFLQEANRLFFHPLGLALEVIVDEENGAEMLGGVWDYRDDPEGMFFAKGMIGLDRANEIALLRNSKIDMRINVADIETDDDGTQLI